jgi:hypothetical protein
MPPRHQPDVVLQAFVFDPHGSCTEQPRYPWGEVQEDGSVRFRLRCWQHTPTYQWEQVVPAAQVRRLVREFVDKALEADPDAPPQASG